MPLLCATSVMISIVLLSIVVCGFLVFEATGVRSYCLAFAGVGRVWWLSVLYGASSLLKRFTNDRVGEFF